MTLTLYGHPFSSYTWKALIALYELGLDFDFRVLDEIHPEHAREFADFATLGKFPVLVEDGLVFEESSIIVEHLCLLHDQERQLLPLDEGDALLLRQFDRICDLYVMNPMQVIVGAAMQSSDWCQEKAVVDARLVLEKGYRWLENRLQPDKWASGWGFTLADCAAAPALFYADWVHPITDALPTLKAYRAKLLARPSVARCVEDARPYRHYFPPGAPDRD